MAHGCKRSGGFVDSSCTAPCDCHITEKFEPMADLKEAALLTELADRIESRRAETGFYGHDREELLSALRAAAGPAPDEMSDEKMEAEMMSEENAENVRLLDYIAKRIGVPHDVELSRESFDAYFAPAPDAGLVEREEFARLTASVNRYHKCRDNRPLIFTMGHDDPLTVGDLRSLLALLSTCAEAGEPVAWQWKSGAWHTVDKTDCIDPEAYARSFGLPVRAIYALPAPSGRDPATIEAVESAAKLVESFLGISNGMNSGDISRRDKKMADAIRALAAPAVLTEERGTP